MYELRRFLWCFSSKTRRKIIVEMVEWCIDGSVREGDISVFVFVWKERKEKRKWGVWPVKGEEIFENEWWGTNWVGWACVGQKKNLTLIYLFFRLGVLHRMLPCSYDLMLTCLINHMLGCSHVWMLTRSHALMITCSPTNRPWWSQTPILTCFDDLVLQYSHALMISCTHAHMLVYYHA